MESQSGILPAIESLRGCIETLSEQLTSYASRPIPPEKSDEFIQVLNELQARVAILPKAITRSYEMLQLVIQSIHSSRFELRKSVDGLIKKTGMQLQKVTSTTEEATNKILDVAERLDEEQTNIISMIDTLESQAKQGTTSDELFAELRSKIYQNQESAFTIMDYLQFQDITAQQIAGAYALLSDTEKTLIYVSDLLKSFDSEHEGGLDMATTVIDENAFNADASFTDQTNVQDAIDDLFATGNLNIDIPSSANSSGMARPTPSSSGETMDADDIDALFAGRTGKSTEQNNASQDDIDSLFNQKKSPEKASQDDIDALFNQSK